MSDMKHSDQPTPAKPGSPSSAEATSPTEPALGMPADPIASTPDASAAATPAESAPADVAAPSAPSNVQERPKTKGVADIVFLVDVSGSMSPCIDALRRNIEAFIDSLSQGDANNAAPVRDWRGKVVGYRDIEAAQAEGLPWIVDNSFVRDAGALKAQLGTLQANGGGDEPESLLDALYTVASMEASPKGLADRGSCKMALQERCGSRRHRLHRCVVQGNHEPSRGEGRLAPGRCKSRDGQSHHPQPLCPQLRGL